MGDNGEGYSAGLTEVNIERQLDNCSLALIVVVGTVACAFEARDTVAVQMADEIT